MWQWNAQSPGTATNSISRIWPTPTISVTSGAPAILRPAPAVAAGDVELHAVQVDRVVPHRQVAHADAHALTGARHERLDRGKHLAVEGPQIEILHHRRVGAVGARVQRPVVQQEAVVAVDGHGSPAFGWMMNMPIMPTAICTISSACGWYMWRAVLHAA
jgi:hypothetical protein